MKKLLVPIDFSDNADRAIAAAKIIATKTKASLLLLHAYQPYIPDMVVPSGISNVPLSNEVEEVYQKRLEEFVANAKAEGFEADSIWAIGGIQPAIYEAIEEHKPDLIVMGRTGTGGFIDKLIGSAATSVALDATCPVLIIPPQATPQRFNTILYASQLEFDENDILAKVIALASQLEARFKILKVNATHQPDIQPDHQFVDQIKAEFALTDADFIYGRSDSVVSGIEELADSNGADLLVVSSRKRGFLEEFLINPSITKKLVLDTHIPLLIYHLAESKIS